MEAFEVGDTVISVSGTTPAMIVQRLYINDDSKPFAECTYPSATGPDVIVHTNVVLIKRTTNVK